jgi:hypothetical protein
MKRLFAASSAAFLLSLAHAQTAYVDVPSCHWAVSAINQVSSGDQPTPAQNASNAQNAVRQIFEGMVCGDSSYTKKFIADAPATLDALVKQKPLRSYVASFGRTVVSGNTATVAVNLTLTLATGVQRRSATLSLIGDSKTAWKVSYASLTSLNLTVFPK